MAEGADESIREAARGGERAVEEQSIPARFDKLLLKYFQRLPDRAKSGAPAAGAAAPAAKPIQPAQDAPLPGAKTRP